MHEVVTSKTCSALIITNTGNIIALRGKAHMGLRHSLAVTTGELCLRGCGFAQRSNSKPEYIIILLTLD